MSRAGPYAVLLLSAVALLLAAQPALLSGLDQTFDLGLLTAHRLPAVIQVLLLSGSALLILGLLWLVRVAGAESRRAAYIAAVGRLAERVGGQVSADAGFVRCRVDDAPGGRLQVDLDLSSDAGLRLVVGRPAQRALLVRRRGGGSGGLRWEPVAQGQAWEIRAGSADRIRRLGEDASLGAALDALFDAPAAQTVRHDHLGIAVQLAAVAPAEVEATVERAYAVAARLATLNT